MDFDRERELEDAGIDAFEFSLMDEDERRQVLDVNFLDPDDYDMIDLEPEFHAWENLQRAGLRLDELSYMDDAEKRSALEDAGLVPDDYDVDSSYYHYSYVSSSKHAAKEEQPKKETPKPKPVTRSVTPGPAKPERTLEKPAAEVYEYCEVKLSYSDQVYYYLTGGLHLETGDRVEVPISATRSFKYFEPSRIDQICKEFHKIDGENCFTCSCTASDYDRYTIFIIFMLFKCFKDLHFCIYLFRSK